MGFECFELFILPDNNGRTVWHANNMRTARQTGSTGDRRGKRCLGGQRKEIVWFKPNRLAWVNMAKTIPYRYEHKHTYYNITGRMPFPHSWPIMPIRNGNFTRILDKERISWNQPNRAEFCMLRTIYGYLAHIVYLKEIYRWTEILKSHTCVNMGPRVKHLPSEHQKKTKAFYQTRWAFFSAFPSYFKHAMLFSQTIDASTHTHIKTVQSNNPLHPIVVDFLPLLSKFLYPLIQSRIYLYVRTYLNMYDKS